MSIWSVWAWFASPETTPVNTIYTCHCLLCLHVISLTTMVYIVSAMPLPLPEPPWNAALCWSRNISLAIAPFSSSGFPRLPSLCLRRPFRAEPSAFSASATTIGHMGVPPVADGLRKSTVIAAGYRFHAAASLSLTSPLRYQLTIIIEIIGCLAFFWWAFLVTSSTDCHVFQSRWRWCICCHCIYSHDDAAEQKFGMKVCSTRR